MKKDAQIQKDGIDQRKWEPWLNAAEIGVSVAAWSAPGVGTVENNLEVEEEYAFAEE